MMGLEVWRRNLTLWAVPLAVCVVGLLGLLIYYSTFDGRVQKLVERHEERTDELAAYREESQHIEEFLNKVRLQNEKIEGLYLDHFETEDRRFTRAIQEVKRLAREFFRQLPPTETGFDAILLTTAPRKIPEPLLDQLRVGGRMAANEVELVRQALAVPSSRWAISESVSELRTS